MTATTTTIAAAATGGVLAVGLAGAAAAAPATTAAPLGTHAAVDAGRRVNAAVMPNGRRLPIYRFSLSSPFGDSSGPHAGRHHAGQDFAAPTGTPVYASVPGRVRIAGRYYGYGNLVDIRTPSRGDVLYGHLSKVLVKRGQRVSAGQRVGLVGSTGHSTGPHLHFEVRTSHGRPSNPLRFLGVSRGRLIHIERLLNRAHR